MSQSPTSDPLPDPVPDPDGSNQKRSFDHENLDVYHAAIRFVGKASQIIEELPQGHSSLAQQLYRASISIPLNIAEGAGEYSRKDKARFYRIALRSTTECAAILDVCEELHVTIDQHTRGSRGLLLRIVAMLTVMVRRLSGSGTGSGTGSDHPAGGGRMRNPKSEIRNPKSKPG